MDRLVTAAALVVVFGCRAGTKPDEGAGSATRVAASDASVTLPVVEPGSTFSPGRVRIVWLDHDQLHLMPEDAVLGVEPDGRTRLPAGAPTTAGALAELRGGKLAIVVVADAAAKATELAPLAAALASRCWALAARTGAPAQVELLATDPCPLSSERSATESDIALWIGADRSMLSLSRMADAISIPDRAGLEAALRAQKQSAAYTDRTDLVFAIHADATVGELATVFATLQRVGFRAARWAPPEGLPPRLTRLIGAGSGTTPP